MVNMYANETAVVGLQPVNEPWQFTPVDWLKVRRVTASEKKDEKGVLLLTDEWWSWVKR